MSAHRGRRHELPRERERSASSIRSGAIGMALLALATAGLVAAAAAIAFVVAALG